VRSDLLTEYVEVDRVCVLEYLLRRRLVLADRAVALVFCVHCLELVHRRPVFGLARLLPFRLWRLDRKGLLRRQQLFFGLACVVVRRLGGDLLEHALGLARRQARLFVQILVLDLGRQLRPLLFACALHCCAFVRRGRAVLLLCRRRTAVVVTGLQKCSFVRCRHRFVAKPQVCWLLSVWP
jgi:hypothetical protein